MMKLAFLPLLALLAACDGASGPAAPASPAVKDAMVRLSPIAGRPAAGYFTLKAPPGTRIAGITSPQAERVELHQTSMEGGVMRMGPLKDAVVPASGELVFASGGNHAMLYGVDPAVTTTIPLTLTLHPGGELQTTATVQRAGQN